jgi:hypothetical protein
MSARQAYDEVIDCITTTNSANVLMFHHSEVITERMSDLIYRAKLSGLKKLISRASVAPAIKRREEGGIFSHAQKTLYKRAVSMYAVVQGIE